MGMEQLQQSPSLTFLEVGGILEEARTVLVLEGLSTLCDSSAAANQFGFFFFFFCVSYQETQNYNKTHTSLGGRYWKPKSWNNPT